jgi:uncharacterized protein YuzE
VPDYQFTPYFENQVMRKRPHLTKEMCIRVVRSPIRAELQGNDRYRFWGRVDGLGGRFLRVITLSDKLTIHNAFLYTVKLNGASGMSDIEVKATRAGESERGKRTSFNYFPDTDSLYIDLSHKQSTESQEVSEGVVLDYDAEEKLIGIDIDYASQKLNLRELVTRHIPLNAKAQS